MSGHSKWSTIKRKKGVADQKRGALFTKLGKAITVAARDGGELDGNFTLRLAVDKAKASNMPKENIERAIKRGTGELKDAAAIEENMYEAYGPGGVAILIKVLTDNKNRASSDIKHILTKHGGSLGAPGSVNWQFKEKGVINIAAENYGGKKADELELLSIDLGAEDVEAEVEGLTIYTTKANFTALKAGLEKSGLTLDSAEIELVPENKVEVDGKMKEKNEKLFTELENQEDVDNYYHNAQI